MTVYGYMYLFCKGTLVILGALRMGGTQTFQNPLMKGIYHK